MSDHIDISRLRDLARTLLLTPDGRAWVAGPWSRGPKTGPHRNAPIYVFDDEETIVADTDSEEVADYLAALDPTTVLALLDRLERAEKLSEAMSLKARLIQEAHERALAERDEARATIQRALEIAAEVHRRGVESGDVSERLVFPTVAEALRRALGVSS